jgi:hypothetical protein
VKSFRLIVFVVILAGCAHRAGSFADLPLQYPISSEAAASIAKHVVKEREKWRRVDCDVASQDVGWKIWVCPKPIRMNGPIALITLDQNGRLTSCEKFYNRE